MQPWPGEVLEERAGEIAVGFAALLTRQAAWRHRRVETITVLSHEQVRRHVSVDFTVPLEHREDMRLSEHGVDRAAGAAGQARRSCTSTCAREDETAVPLLRSDEARLIARELLYLVLDLDAEDADTRRRDAADRVDPGRQARGGGRRSTPRSRSSRSSSGRCPGSRRSPGRLTRGFLLCAVLNDVDAPARDQVRLRRAARAAGPRGALLRRAGLHGGGELPRRGRRPGRDARAHHRDGRQPHGRVLAAGPRDADRPAIHYVADAEERIEPGLSVTLRHRARPLPGPGGAGGVGDRARAGAAVAVRRPGRAGDLRRARRSPSCSRPRRSSRPGAAQRRAPAGAARARALPAVPRGGDGRGGGRRRRRSRSARRSRRRWSSPGASAPLWPSCRRVS